MRRGGGRATLGARNISSERAICRFVMELREFRGCRLCPTIEREQTSISARMTERNQRRSGSASPRSEQRRRAFRRSPWFWIADFFIIVAVGVSLGVYKYAMESNGSSSADSAFEGGYQTTPQTATPTPATIASGSFCPTIMASDPNQGVPTDLPALKAITTSWLTAWQYGLAHHDEDCLRYAVYNFDEQLAAGWSPPYGESDGPIAITCWFTPESPHVTVDYTAGGVPYSTEFDLTAGVPGEAVSNPHYQVFSIPANNPPGTACQRLAPLPCNP